MMTSCLWALFNKLIRLHMPVPAVHKINQNYCFSVCLWFLFWSQGHALVSAQTTVEYQLPAVPSHMQRTCSCVCGSTWDFDYFLICMQMSCWVFFRSLLSPVGSLTFRPVVEHMLGYKVCRIIRREDELMRLACDQNQPETDLQKINTCTLFILVIQFG